MINIKKKIFIMFLLVFAILCTTFAYSVNATEGDSGFANEDVNGFIYYGEISGQYSNEYGDFDFTILKGDLLGQLIIESLRQHSYDDGGYIPLSDLYEYYDVLCCQKGTKLPSINETYLKGSNGDRLNVSFPYLTMNDIGKEIFKEDDRREPFGSEVYTNLTLGFYVGGEINVCRPKEAYILAEMVKELEGAVFYYDIATDENGNQIRYEGSLEGAQSFMIGDEEVYIVEKEYVAVLPDGSNVQVEEVIGADGTVSYKYKEGSYQNQYVKYEGSLEWNDNKFGSGGTYPSFEYNSSSSNVNSGVVENEVPGGTQIYVTGSKVVVKQGEYYYHATVEGNNSYIQLAWWTTIAGGSGNTVNDTAFSQEAAAFEAYILQAAGVTSTDQLEHTTVTVEDENGEEKTYEHAFKFDYEPTWIEDGEFEYPTSIFEADKQSFLVGPFSIDYIEAKAQFGGRPEVEFAGITNMELYTDASEEPLVYGEQWEFVYLDGERLEEENEPAEGEEAKISYPKSNEKFYIRLLDSENATKITNIKVHFRYMNASGTWQELHGNYFKATWDQQSKDFDKWVPCEWDEETGDPIDWEPVYDYTQYWLELTSMEQHDSQFLGLGIKAAKWYEYCTLERAVDIHDGKVVIQKKIVDEDGNEVDEVDRNDFFTFKITVDGAINSGTEQVKVRAGEAVESKVYYWMGDEAPTYTVEEIDTGDYELIEIENSTGILKPNGIDTVIAVGKNRVKDPKEGYIDLIKLIQDNNLSDRNEFVGKEFDFTVTISGTFEYNGEQFEDSSAIISVAVPAAISQDEAQAISVGPIYWYGDAPRYKIEEEKTEGTSLVSIIPSGGTLIENEAGTNNPTSVVSVTTNRVNNQSANLRIIKVLDGSSGLSREYIESLSFTFEIEVKYENGEVSKERLHLKRPTRQDENGNWVWEGQSSKYVWAYGEANPTYTIKEIDIPEGTTLDEGNSQMSGTLTSNGTNGYEIKNVITNVLNAPKTGRIEITKTVEEDTLYNREFKFAVKITGDDFKYVTPSGNVIEALKTEDGRKYFVFDGDYSNPQYGSGIQLTNSSAIVLNESGEYDINNFVLINTASGSGTWLSGEFTWYGDKAPEYKVEENLLGDDIASSVEPSEGMLSDTQSGVVKVTAWNRDNTPKGGYLHIIKTLENAEKYSVEYVNSLVFKFKIQVDGYNETIVSLKPELVNNKWVWEYLSDRYSWKSGEDAPNYTITEIDLPAGTEFVSASGPDGSSASGMSVTGKIKESVSEEVLITTDNSFINKLPNANEGNLTIEKKVTHGSLNGKEFNFEVILKGSFEYGGAVYTNQELRIPVTVKGGEQVNVGPVKWYGNEAPEYSVIEKESNDAINLSVINGSGTLAAGTSTVVTCINEAKLVGGSFIIGKTLEGDGLQGEKYTFRVTVKDGNTGATISTNIVTLAAGENYKSEMYKWYSTEKAPIVTVEEINLPAGVTVVGESVQIQTLQEGEEAQIRFAFVNKYEQKSGRFKIKKVILDEKLLDASIIASQEFKIKIRVQGDYKIANEQNSYYKDATFNITLKGGEVYNSPEIIWWGENAPVVTVEEYDLPMGWQNVGISNNGSPIDENGSLEIVVTNKLPVYPILELTTKLAGTVWEDEAQDKDGKNTPESVANGKIDPTEGTVEGDVEVYIYKVVRDANGKEVERTLATVYKDINNTPLTLPIITSGDGSWSAPRVKIPAVTEEQEASGYTAGYDVEFIYDGQTYEPTKFLATSNGDAASFVNATTAGKDAYQKDSMALDYDREVVNNRIQTIKGNSPIDGNGDTTGTAEGNGKESSLFYKSDAPENDSNNETKNVSKLQTLNEDNSVKELFKTKARTSIGGLLFPFYKDAQNWNGFHLTNVDTTITELGLEQKFFYEAVYNYCLHINLGLVKRPDADLGIAKDLYSAKVTLKGEEITPIDGGTFRFNTLDDLSGDYYSRQVVNQQSVPYTLGLYSTDYYYRAEMYQDDTALYDKVVELSKTMTNNEFSEMEVELRYEIAVYNESGSYIQVVKGINDYFDSSFGEPIKVEIPGGGSHSVTETGIIGSDGVTYNKLEIKDMNLSLASGEVAKIYVTFKVQKDTINGVHDTIILGKKSNVAEISSYSTLNLDGTNAGKVDKDSAPDNLNIRSFNEYSWYEDDTDAAPVLYLELKDENRIINGQVWEDKPEDSNVGNGKLDDGEALIGGLTTQLVEKVEVDGILYDFVWPTSESLNCLGGRSLKDLTGFDSTIETAREKVVTDEGTENEKVTEVGSYEFTRVPTGDYVVRFLYGNDKTTLDDTLEITGDAEALTKEGDSFHAEEKILTANYDDDKPGMTAAVYNGQDYKATIYQAGYTSVDGNGYINNRQHDITNAALNSDRVSDARDSESRRLEVIANSETIMNENSNILYSANDKEANHTELYRQYYMYADTASIKLELEAEKEEPTIISNIDCGLIERPETALVLDKEISSIKMTTNDNKVIFNADYDVTYGLTNNPADKVIISEVDGQYLVANVKLKDSSIGIDVLQAIDKNENKLASSREENYGTQNFRFINIDSEMFQGTTIEVEYQLTALNVGEVDYTSEVINNMYKTAKENQTTEKLEIVKRASEIRQNNARTDSNLEIGKYLGTNYYTGNVRNDQKVITRVRQVVDYVDNDFVFTPAMNTTRNNVWKNANVTELAGNGYDQERLLDKTVLSEYELIDKHGVAYITEYKNNVILSVDTLNSITLSEDLNAVGNFEFERDLTPYDKDENPEEYKSQITLVVSKTVSAEDKDLSFDNIAEIVKYQNTVGRRDALTVTGNANPKLGEFIESLEERDSSATELITFTPPTGIKAEVTMTTQILIVIAIAAVIVVGGILIIKKKVLS